MKEAYFTPETIQFLAEEWQAQYGRPRQASRQPFELARAGLLLLDLQRYFLDPDSHAYVPSSPAILPGLKLLAARFRKAGRPVLATRHINTPENAGRMAAWWSELISSESEMAEISADLDILPEEILDKPQYDAFYASALPAQLERNGVEQLVIGGVMTHLCCETTARAAFVRGFEVFFLVDGTATYNRDFHTATLRNLAHGAAVLIPIGQLLEAI